MDAALPQKPRKEEGHHFESRFLSDFPRIEKRYARAIEVAGIPCNQRQVVMNGGGRQQAIDDR
jgi:hypothetical protein